MIMLILLFNILMASTFTFSKAALWYLSPLVLIMIRFLASGTCLLGYLWRTNPGALYIPLQDWHLFFAIMLIPFYGAFVLDNWSLQFISSSKSCLIYNLMPLISALIAYIGFKRKITPFQWLILFFGFISLIPILKTDIGLQLPESTFPASLIIEKVCAVFAIMIGIVITCKQQLTRLEWVLSISGIGFLLIILSSAQHAFPYQTVSHIPEMALLISVALAAWGWLLIQHMLIEKNYNLLLVNGIGLFGAGLLSGLHLIIVWTAKIMPMFLPGLFGFLPSFCVSQWCSKQTMKEKYIAVLGAIGGFLFVVFLNFLYRSMIYPSPVPGVWQPTTILELWQPNEHDTLFKIISSVLPFELSYWATLSVYVGWLIVACHLFGYTLYSYLLKQYSATFLAFTGTTIPLIAAVLGYIFLEEAMPAGFGLSFVLMTACLLLFYKEEQKEG